VEFNQPHNNLQVLLHILGNVWIEKELEEYRAFRQRWSPKARWYHRRPTVSPIVPVLYWNMRETYKGDLDPFGFWGGRPEEVLDRIGEEINHFQNFWESLPDNRGIEHLQWALTKPQRFFSFCHELTTSYFLASKPDVYVEPLFFNPVSAKGTPDFIVKIPHREFAVQCKSEDPSAATQMPYELFQYFAGIFHRLVEDSGRSFHLSLILKKKMDLDQINIIRNRVDKLIKREVTIPYPWSTPYCDLELDEIRNMSARFDIDRIFSRIKRRSNDPLYQEFVQIEDNTALRSKRRAASLLILGKRGEETYQVIQSAIKRSVKDASLTLPLIIAVHLYQDIEWNEFWNRPSMQQQFKPWTDKFFKENPGVAMIYLSSNHEIYLKRSVNDNQVAIKHSRQGFVIESPEWDYNDVKDLGI
jgi:hypothetical protein